jgi:hypothetical protein
MIPSLKNLPRAIENAQAKSLAISQLMSEYQRSQLANQVT